MTQITLKLKKGSEAVECKFDFSFTVNTLKAIRKLGDEIGENLDIFNLPQGKAQEFLMRLYGDPILLVSLSGCVLEDQLNDQGIEPGALGRLNREQIDEVRGAFLKSYIDFFQNPAQRRVMTAAMERLDKEMKAELAEADQLIETGELDQVMDEAMARDRLTYGDMSTRLREGLELTPADTASANSSG